MSLQKETHHIMPSKNADTKLEKSIQLNEVFWTLQGEGRWTGHRALFVRFPFCNYDCPWCDTDYSSFEKWNEKNFVDMTRQEKAKLAVLTGGEPMAHKHLMDVIRLLKGEGFVIACETNGSLPVPKEVDWVTTSPKRYTQGKWEPYFIHPSVLNRTNEWKYVVDADFDFNILNRHHTKGSEQIFSLSPEYSEFEKNTHRILEFIKENPAWKLSLQTHKWLGIR
ncbi:MAG: 7-carboxy-7-deazaguanine synthase QueE [Bdellovibrionales bacterium]|nr:7-carboxy-7-deazaguanine synthase QueE [Bdellovibrionales bacterium]